MLEINIAFEQNLSSAITAPEIFEAQIRANIRRAVIRAADKLETEAEADALLPKSGIQYPGMPRQSSAPGEAPAKQSGKLLESIRKNFSEGGLTTTIGPTVEYAQYLRDGLGGSENARPILEPALGRVAPGFIEQIMRIVKEAV